jgi:hypothetical protein
MQRAKEEQRAVGQVCAPRPREGAEEVDEGAGVSGSASRWGSVEVRGGDLPTYKRGPLISRPCQHQSPPRCACVAKLLCKATIGGYLNGFAKVRGLNTWFYRFYRLRGEIVGLQ